MRTCERLLTVAFSLIALVGRPAVKTVGPETAPPPRGRAEVEAVLAKAPAAPPVDQLRELHIVLVAGPKDHGPNAHDYPLWQKRWAVLLGGLGAGGPSEPQVNLYGPAPCGRQEQSLKGAPKLKIETAMPWPDKEQFQKADLVVLQCYARWNEERVAELDQYLNRGGGLVAIHPVVITTPQWALKVADLIGLAWEDGYTRFREGPLDVTITAPNDPICLGLPVRIHFLDEAYWPLRGDSSKVHVLATSNETIAKGAKQTKPEPMYWTSQVHKGRVFVCLPGHYVWSFDDPYFRLLLLRGMAWAAGESPYRFDSLALRDAVLSDDDPAKPPLERAFLQLQSYGWDQSRAPLALIDAATSAALAVKDNAALKDLERRHATVLTARSTIAGKQYSCRQLARIGSDDSVPALATLLADRDLSHPARMALERVPGPAVGQALLKSLASVDDNKLKVGVIDSLGVRRDEPAVPALARLLSDPDSGVAVAAANSLAKIGTPEAARALADAAAQATGPRRANLLDACANAALSLAAAGHGEEAARMCDRLFASGEVPPYAQAAALQVRVAARPAEAAALLIRALGGADKRLWTVAARMIRQTTDEGPLKAVAAALPGLPPGAQVLILDAMGERGFAAGRPAVLGAMDSPDIVVRQAALRALGAVGDSADVPRLAEAAAGPPEISQAARDSLARLAVPGVNQGIVDALPREGPEAKSELLRGLARRGATEATPSIAQAAEDRDPRVRQAAVESLADLAGEAQIHAFVQMVKTNRGRDDLAMVEKALGALAGRLGGPCAGDLVAGLANAAPEVQAVLLRTLGRIGGPKALAAERAAVRAENRKVKDAAIRALSDWPTPEPMADLVDLAKTSQNEVWRALALRGFVRMIELPAGPPANEALRLCQDAMKLASNDAEKKLVLSGVAKIKSVEALDFAASCLDQEALRQEAAAAALAIARNLGANDSPDVKPVLDKVRRLLGVDETGLPVGWKHQDIGAPALAGSATYDVLERVFTIKGGGQDIWETADQFHFVYQTLQGDGQILAKVRAVSRTDDYAKAGVMIRGGLEASAHHALMNLTPGQGAKFTWRSGAATAQKPVHGTSNGIAAPYWVKLVRQGDRLSGFCSSDGQEWKPMGEATIQLPATALVGLAVTSHNPERLCAAEFSDVAIPRNPPQQRKKP